MAPRYGSHRRWLSFIIFLDISSKSKARDVNLLVLKSKCKRPIAHLKFDQSGGDS